MVFGGESDNFIRETILLYVTSTRSVSKPSVK
jgi:hypothetical protein